MPAKGTPQSSRPDSAKPGELLDIDQAIAALKTTRPTFYRWLRQGKLKGMKAGRQWRFYRQDLDLFMAGEAPRTAESPDMSDLISQIVKHVGGAETGERHGKDVVAALNLILLSAVRTRGTEVHITPIIKPGSQDPVVLLSFRIDGLLQTVAEFDGRMRKPLIERIKWMANCDLNETRAPQCNRVEIKIDQKVMDIIVATMPTSLGETMTLRFLSKESVTFELSQLGFSDSDRERIERLLQLPWGLIAVTGPSGSGKTTVLYSLVGRLAGCEKKVISLENPVEYQLPWVVQVVASKEAGLPMPAAIRAAMRAAPNVIVVSELREAESLFLLQDAALSGHLALVQMHTDDAANALQRMIDMGTDPFVVSESTKMVIGVRLVRRLCPDCSVERRPTEQQLADAATAALNGGLVWARLPQKFRAPIGCAKCSKLGFRGRMQIGEVLEVTPEIRAGLRRGGGADQIRRAAVKQGMTTFLADGIRRAAQGETALEEVLWHAPRNTL